LFPQEGFIEMTRRFDRKALDVRMTVEGESIDGQVWFTTGDISEGGAYLVSSFLLEIGTALKLTLPGIEGHEIELSGRVKWVNLGMDDAMSGKQSGMGIEFENVDDRTLLRLTAFLNANQ
jgi:hypothetical protein